jgi:hypothetical protein
MQSLNTSFTCMDFFSNNTLIQAVLNPTNWQSSYFDMRNYCLYCNHSTSVEFQQAILTNNSVLYFWRHESIVCNKYPAILYFRYDPYFDQVKSANSSLSSLSPKKLSDFLFFTNLRTTTSNFIGEQDRNEFFYICMFFDSKTYGFLGDIYEISIVQVRVRGMWIVDTIIRTVILVFMIILIWIPRIKIWIKEAKKLRGMSVKELIIHVISALQLQVLVYATVALLLGYFESAMSQNSTVPGYKVLDGDFRLVANLIIALGSFLLLILWANIVHAATNMDNSSVLAKRYLAAVAAIYIFLFIFVIAGLITYGVTTIAQKYAATTAFMFVGGLFCIMYLLGFSVYGLRILWLFKSGRSKVDILKLRVTRLILLSNFSWVLLVVILIVLGTSYSFPYSVYTFFVVFNVILEDYAIMLVIITHMIIIFRYDLFVECYSFLCQCKPVQPNIESPPAVEA